MKEMHLIESLEALREVLLGSQTRAAINQFLQLFQLVTRVRIKDKLSSSLVLILERRQFLFRVDAAHDYLCQQNYTIHYKRQVAHSGPHSLTFYFAYGPGHQNQNETQAKVQVGQIHLERGLSLNVAERTPPLSRSSSGDVLDFIVLVVFIICYSRRLATC